MNEIQIYERDGRIFIMAADMLKVSGFDDREYAHAFPVFSLGQCGAQATLFIPG